jgi:hypothetical protein
LIRDQNIKSHRAPWGSAAVAGLWRDISSLLPNLRDLSDYRYLFAVMHCLMVLMFPGR